MKQHYLQISFKIFFLSIILTVFSCEKDTMSLDKNEIITKKVDSLLALMTLEEKIGQMSQVRHFWDIQEDDIASKFIGSVIHTEGPAPGATALEWQNKFTQLQKQALSTRLGIPLLFAVDAVHGQNTFEGATIFPHNIGLGATRNEKLVEEIAKITAIEVQATGFNWTFSPCIAIPYNEKWGRVYEAFSESTDVTSKMAVASVKGLQGNLADKETIMATAKHFVGDGATDFGVEGGITTLTENEVSERLMPPYKLAVKAGVGAIMTSFNLMNNKPMHAHKALIIDTLKTNMKFDGIVVSDWKAYSRFGGNAIVKAGIDMVMAVDGDLVNFQEGVKKGVEDQSISLERIDDAVRRILRQKFRLGLFENPYPNKNLIEKIGIVAHRNIARQAVRESLVLLKNENDILPINKNTNKIVVVGEHADNAGLQSGGWTINWQGSTKNYKGATTILEGIKAASKGEVVYQKEVSKIHKDADLAIIVVGETPYAEFFGDIGHASNQLTLSLTDAHQNYINQYKKAGIKVLTVLITGRPLLVTEAIEKSDAFVVAWLPGSEGNGIAEVLFGDYNFTGKLPHTWPDSIDDFIGKYGPNFWDTTINPKYPFGFGLEYKN